MASLWEDPEGPALAAVSGVAASDMVLARPAAILASLPGGAAAAGGEPSLFVDGSDEGDVCQGALGDCWFLGALSVIGTRDDLLHHVVVSTHPELGYYEFQFFKAGQWRQVKVDDRIPCRRMRSGQLQPLYARSPDPRELWVSLMEKAYAKLHGGYPKLDGGQVDYALVDLTGGVTDSSEMAAGKGGQDEADAVWRKLCWAVEEGWLMGCAHIASGAVAESDLGGTGLLINHAYGVLDARIVKGEKIVRVRNPWGTKEWEGRWGDNSSEWTPELLAELDFELADDGTFWMALEDFMKWFNRLYVVRLYHDSVGKIWERHLVRGTWEGDTAGGCVNFPTWKNNPQIGLKAAGSDPVRAFIQLTQTDERYSGQKADTIGFVLFRSDDHTKRTENAYQKDVVLSPTYTNTRDVNHEITLEPGVEYVLMVSMFDAGTVGDHTAILWSEDPIKVHTLPPAAAGGGSVTPVAPTPLELTSGVDADDFAGSAKKKAPPVRRGQPSGKSFRKPRTEPRRNAPGAAAASGSSAAAAAAAAGSDDDTYESTSGPYIGTVKAGKMHGQGTYTFDNGDTFTGEFVEGVRTGKGKYTFKEVGDVYEGEFEDDQFHGQGTMTYGSGAKYTGSWKKGARDGQGVFTHANGDVYEGVYAQNERHGAGKLTFADGDVQEGTFAKGVLHGQGKSSFANGNVYTGEFRNGEITGRGVLVLKVPEEARYEGDFVDGMRHGQGTYVSAKGDKYVGGYRQNQMDGQGRFERANGDVYVGAMEGGVPHGEGTYTTKAGRVITGEFNKGSLPKA